MRLCTVHHYLLLLLIVRKTVYGFNFNFTQKSIRLQGKTGACEEINAEYLTDVQCSAVRKKTGYRISVTALILKEADEIWMMIRIFHKAGNQFIQITSTWDLDFCGIQAGSVSLPPFISLVLDALKIVLPHIYHPCPYVGDLRMEDVNIADVIENVIPQVIPNGTYKAWIRTYRKSDNITYAVAWGIADISAVDVKKSYKMG